MTGKIYHPEQKHPEPYQQDLGPDALKGLNHGLAGSATSSRTAYDMKDLHEILSDFSHDELRQMPVLDSGTRLETDAVYLKISGNQRQQIEAMGDEEVDPNSTFLAKKDLPYELWNRLIGIDDVRRTKKGQASSQG